MQGSVCFSKGCADHVCMQAPTVLDAAPEPIAGQMSWTCIIGNTSVEDDPVLRVIPYFCDDDREVRRTRPNSESVNGRMLHARWHFW